MKVLFNKIKFKIILVLFFSFLLSSFLKETIFLGATPKIRPNFISATKRFIADLINPKEKESSQQTLVQVVKFPDEKFFKTITKGVKAFEDKKHNVYYIKYTKEAEFEERKIKTPDGREIKIYIPKGLIKD